MQVRTLRSIVYVAAGLGLIVSLFATAEFFDSALRTVCTINTYVNCGKVDASPYTLTLGVPDYAWGIAGFVAILVVNGLGERDPDRRAWTWLLLALTTAGVGLALWLLYVEVGIIGALCPVCATAYLLGVGAWIGAIALARVPATPEDLDADGTADAGAGAAD